MTFDLERTLDNRGAYYVFSTYTIATGVVIRLTEIVC